MAARADDAGRVSPVIDFDAERLRRTVPEAMRAAPRWLLWRKVPHADATKKPRKVPFYVDGTPRRGALDTPDDVRRLATLDQALAAMAGGSFAGVGFALGDDGTGWHWQGIDLDAIDQRPALRELVARLPGYVETSPGGGGAHALGLGAYFQALGSNASGIEAYAKGRYFTVTGAGGRGQLSDLAPFVAEVLHPLHGGGREAPGLGRAPVTAESFFAKVNVKSLLNLPLWVPKLLPQAQAWREGYRITSRALGRDLEEDLQILPQGICDFGEEAGKSAIDLVLEWGQATNPTDAAQWLCDCMGVAPAALGWRQAQAVPEPPGWHQPRAVDPEPTPMPVGEPPWAGEEGEWAAEGPPAGRPSLKVVGGRRAKAARSAPEGPAIDPDWRQGLIVKHRRDGAVMVPCRVHNLMLILRCAPEFAGRIRYNEFLQVTEVDGQPMVDGDLARLKARIERTWMPEEKVTTTDLLEAVRGMEHENCYHPVRDYLLSLTWDGIPRIEAFFPDHLETPNDAYHQGVARAFFLSAVGRIFTPGLKVDVMVILEGAQGKMKSSMWETLGGDWYADITDDINNKDFQAGLQGTWIADLGELDQFGKADSSRIKSIITIRHDRLRRPYARFHQTLSRQTVLVGSSNRSDWLNDPTGGRRFLPVSCLTERIDIGLIARARDQLWAEATQRYRAGEAGWWDVPDAATEQMSRFNEDPWHDPIKGWLGDRRETSTAEVLEFCLKVELARQTRSDQIRVGNVMLVLGWRRRRVRSGTELAWQYFRDVV